MSHNPRNADYTKEYNRHMFLRLLRGEPMSRVDITRSLGLTRSATTLIADELLSEGLISETSAVESSMRGRPPMPLAINGDAIYSIGVYLSRNGFEVGLVNLCDELKSKIALSFDSNSGRDKTELLIKTILQLIEDCDIPKEKICGIGISCPGPINEEKGLILNAPHFKLWANTDLGPKLSKALSLPVYLEKDAACLARYNIGKIESESNDFLLLLFEGGVGSGIVSGGQLLKSLGGYTCEIGHCSINYNGPKCECGNNGCLEYYASLNKILQGSSYNTWQELMERKDEKEAESLIDLESDYLAAGIVTATNIISFDCVLLAGDIIYGIETLAPIVEKKVNSRMIQHDQIHISVKSAVTNPGFRIVAAADVAFDHYLSL